MQNVHFHLRLWEGLFLYWETWSKSNRVLTEQISKQVSLARPSSCKVLVYSSLSARMHANWVLINYYYWMSPCSLVIVLIRVPKRKKLGRRTLPKNICVRHRNTKKKNGILVNISPRSKTIPFSGRLSSTNTLGGWWLNLPTSRSTHDEQDEDTNCKVSTTKQKTTTTTTKLENSKQSVTFHNQSQARTLKLRRSSGASEQERQRGEINFE